MANKDNYDIAINNVLKEFGEEKTNNILNFINSLKNTKTNKSLNYEQKCFLLYVAYKYLKEH